MLFCCHLFIDVADLFCSLNLFGRVLFLCFFCVFVVFVLFFYIDNALLIDTRLASPRLYKDMKGPTLMDMVLTIIIVIK